MSEELKNRIRQLAGLRRFSRGQLLIQWNPKNVEVEAKLRPRLAERVTKEMPKAESHDQGPSRIYLEPSTESEAHVGPGIFTLRRAFTGNVASSQDLLESWLKKHWGPVLGDFGGLVVPRFIALVIDVEMSSDNILEEPELRKVIQRFFVKVPNWQDLADAEFRICREIENRYYLNFGLSTYRTLNVQLVPQGVGKAPLAQNNGVIDRGLKLQVDANTKVNVLRDTGEIEVGPADFDRCLRLALDSIKNELESFLTHQDAGA